MKTHELAKVLNELSRILRSGPDIEIGELRNVMAHTIAPRRSPTALAVNIHTLVALSEISKKEWVSLIDVYGFPISVKPRDSARNILGKVLNYLKDNKEARKKLINSAKTAPESSPELLKALSILLKDE